ncbi:hypothetical protein C8F04DRAFT_1179256 [Mycena alexandri]|uniref:Uncharacterized protein n=1 Tax=Mycena alexandri TaxID=1745969 RepID=A0AAD6T5P5_9AGAR|nr:hypothetical protein C8F04DRAFT_1179256 [Mycena alexandri]
MQSAQPVAAHLPALLQLIPAMGSSSLVASSSSLVTRSSSPIPTRPNSPSPPSAASSQYSFLGLPPLLSFSASRGALLENNRQLVAYTARCKEQMASDYTSNRLMDAENGRLREELFAKKNKPAKQRVGGLAYVDWKAGVAIVHTEFLQDERVGWKDIMEEAKRLEKEVVDAQKAVERQEKRAEADAEKARKKAEVDLERAHKKAETAAIAAEKKRLLDEEKAKKKAVTEAVQKKKKEEAEAERDRKALERQMKAANKPKKGNKRKRIDDTHLENAENSLPPHLSHPPDMPPSPKRMRPNPRPMFKGANSMAVDAASTAAPLSLFAPIPPAFGGVLTNFDGVIDPSLE